MLRLNSERIARVTALLNRLYTLLMRCIWRGVTYFQPRSTVKERLFFRRKIRDDQKSTEPPKPRIFRSQLPRQQNQQRKRKTRAPLRVKVPQQFVAHGLQRAAVNVVLPPVPEYVGQPHAQQPQLSLHLPCPQDLAGHRWDVPQGGQRLRLRNLDGKV